MQAPPIIVDQGTNYFRTSFAGEKTCINGIFEPQICVENSIIHPFQTGTLQNVDLCEQIYMRMYKKLHAESMDHPIVLSETCVTSKKDRENMMQLMFENFFVPSMFVAMDAAMALYAANCTSGLVIDVGEQCTRASVVYEGQTVRAACHYVPYGGSHVTMQFQKLLMSHTVNVSMEHVELMKRRGYVAKNYNSEQERFKTKDYELPDGTMITLHEELYQSHEVLFQPSLLGMDNEPSVPALVLKSLQSIPSEYHSLLLKNMVCNGGGTFVDGFASRLQHELQLLHAQVFTSMCSDEVWRGLNFFAILHHPRSLNERNTKNKVPTLCTACVCDTCHTLINF